jgi:hypothetical protein
MCKAYIIHVLLIGLPNLRSCCSAQKNLMIRIDTEWSYNTLTHHSLAGSWSRIFLSWINKYLWNIILEWNVMVYYYIT